MSERPMPESVMRALEVPEPSCCPTCGSEDPAVRVPEFNTALQGWQPDPCPDTFHHPTQQEAD